MTSISRRASIRPTYASPMVRPVVGGVPIRTLLERLARGDTFDALLRDHPAVSEDDLREVVAFAAGIACEQVPLRTPRDLAETGVTGVRPIEQMVGDHAEETLLFREAQREAVEYLSTQPWCRSIRETYFGAGMGGILAVFLFRIDPDARTHEWQWVIVGDLPFAHVDIENAAEPALAVERYCDLMDSWIRAVRQRTPLADAFPVQAKPNAANAEALERRVAFLRSEVVPFFRRE